MTTTMEVELLGKVSIYIGLGIEITTALVLGGVIGFDRERRYKAAGIRTNILICLGATLYTAMSMINITNVGLVADPNRTAAQIVSGIGFLGAGAIIQGRGGIRGMTSAATIWVVAAIGVTIGIGYPFVATIFTITILSVLNLMGPLYKFMERDSKIRTFHVEILAKGDVEDKVREVLDPTAEHIKLLVEETLHKKSGENVLSIHIDLHPRRIRHLHQNLKQIVQVEKVSFRPLNRDLSIADNDVKSS